MGSFIIEGGHRLQGEVIPQGAKNEALQILCAVLLTAEPVTIHNLPDIVDVNKLIHLLGDLGVKTQHLGPGSWRFEADDVNLDHLKSESFRVKGGGLRGSVMILGPMLGRFGVGAIPRPGGDKIGRRRMDTHFIGFQKARGDLLVRRIHGLLQRERRGRPERDVHVARRSLGHRHRQRGHGRGVGRGNHHDLQHRV